MLPSNVDPRRPDKVHRLKSKQGSSSGSKGSENVTNANGNGQAEDLTPDYMNILGQPATTANAVEAPERHGETIPGAEPDLPVHQLTEEKHHKGEDSVDGPIAAPVTVVTTNATNVIPTSPQYGVAIISSPINPADMITASIASVAASIVDTTAKASDDAKDIHSTPSRSERFKVVKIASLEPFKRGRWKCMDYVDEAPPAQVKVTQSTGSIQVAGGVYFQTQSLPQQQIQQMLLQSGFTNGTQFIPTQMIPQGQYFYPQVSGIQTQTLPQQIVNSTGVPSSMPTQFINTSQPYFPAGVLPNAAGFTMPQSYPNIQYVHANMLQNQNSAFVPITQAVQMPTNFQQSQTYAGQPNVTQSTVTQPLVNGHAFPPQGDQVTTSSLPTQPTKNVILTTNNAQPASQSQINQPNVPNQIPQTNSQSQSVPVIQNLQFQQNQNFQQVPKQSQTSSQVQGTAQTVNTTPVVQAPSLIQVPQVVSVPSQTFDQSLASNVYTNPQFTMSVNSLTVLENNENSAENVGESGTGSETTGESSDDPAKTNPVVNAIDNKIEQAMDLVKSHLMYTVREEVEVLKEKIAELMERIQQLETENNFLRSQIPKNQTANPNTSVASVNPPSVSTNTPAVNPAPVNTPSVNPTPVTNVPSTGEIPAQQ